MEAPSWTSPIIVQRRPAYEHHPFSYIMKGAESEQLVAAPFISGWAAEKMQDSFAFLILGVGRLKEDQLIYVESRENVIFIIWDL